MEDKISKPNIVRGIPVPFIRPLPTLYYYGTYCKIKAPSHALEYFKSSINYLSEATELLATKINDDRFKSLSKTISGIVDLPNNDISSNVYSVTSELSELCLENSKIIKEDETLSKNSMATRYRSKITPLKILLINNNHELERVKKISATLQNTCYYDTTIIPPNTDGFVDKINMNDFIIFTSAYPININEEVQNIKRYKKPCLIMANLTKDKQNDQQTLRNGAWLQQRGYEVLYKIFTPLRLFTTIDKIFMKVQLSN